MLKNSSHLKKHYYKIIFFSKSERSLCCSARVSSQFVSEIYSIFQLFSYPFRTCMEPLADVSLTLEPNFVKFGAKVQETTLCARVKVSTPEVKAITKMQLTPRCTCIYS